MHYILQTKKLVNPGDTYPDFVDVELHILVDSSNDVELLLGEEKVTVSKEELRAVISSFPGTLAGSL